jgi:PAS domain S-box-containing protein
MPDPCLLLDAVGPDYTVIEVSKAREAILDAPREEVVGRPLFSVAPYTAERFTAAFIEGLREHLRHVVRTGRSYQLEPIPTPVLGVNDIKRTAYLQTTYIPLRDLSGAVRYVLAVTHDVSDEIHAAEQAKTIESRLSAALKMGNVGSWVYDVATSRVMGDGNFMRMFKMSKKSAAAYSLDMLMKSVHPNDRMRVAASVKRSLDQGSLFEEEYRVILDDGTQRWLLARGEPVTQEDSLQFSGVVVDLTEQRDLRAQVELAREQDRLNRRAARILQERNEELEAISRSKDEFVALASHQLRTPATAVKQYIGMVLQGYVGDITSEQADVLGRAFESNERQIQIINQILSAARVDTGKLVMTPALVDLRLITWSIARDMESDLQGNSHTLTLDLTPNPVQITADIDYLRMAIENILHNAIVYTPPGGHITVALKRRGGSCVLSIADTGVGIKKADLSKLFVKFSRIHNPLSVEAGGSGIGLYLAAEIIRLHGGTIGVESRIGKGSTFAISLPIVKDIEENGAHEQP